MDPMAVPDGWAAPPRRTSPRRPGIATVAIAVVSGVAFYVASYSTGEAEAKHRNDLRVRLYHHLQQLSLAFYDHNRVGTILSTLTDRRSNDSELPVNVYSQHLHRRPHARCA